MVNGILWVSGTDIDLRGLHHIPDGVNFINDGYVHLNGNIPLSNGITFNNNGAVYLMQMSQQHDIVDGGLNMVFNNDGDVRTNLTTIPTGLVFNNSGRVFLPRLNHENQIYCGQRVRIRHLDGHTLIIGPSKSVEDFVIFSAHQFACHSQRCYVAQYGMVETLGKTVREAVENLRLAISRLENDIRISVSSIGPQGHLKSIEFNRGKVSKRVWA
jgi:hypothetical protein